MRSTLSSSSMVSMPTVRLILRRPPDVVTGFFLARITFWKAKRPGARLAIRSSTGRTKVWYAL